MEAWVIKFGERTLSSDQANGAHLAIVADLVGDQWGSVSPWAGPRSLMAWLVAIEAGGNGGDLAAAMAYVYATPITDIVDCLSTPESVAVDG